MKVTLLPSEKFLLTVAEATAYFGIGEKKIRELAKEPDTDFTVKNGNKLLIRRKDFEKYLSLRPEI